MTAGGTAADDDPVPVETVLGAVVVHPGDGGPDLPDDLLERCVGCQSVVDGDRGDARVGEHARHEGGVMPRQRPPVPAVDRHEHRAQGAPDSPDVKPFGAVGVEADIGEAVETVDGLP